MYIGRPILNMLLKNIEITQQRNKKIIDVVENYGYSQKKVADYLVWGIGRINDG